MKGINTTSNPKSNYKANDNEENENNGASS
jgi:hypothetical protein